MITVDMPKKTKDQVEGWKEILGALAALNVAVSERTARRWLNRRRDPLPVWRFMGRLVSTRGKLDAWVERQMIHAGARAAS